MDHCLALFVREPLEFHALHAINETHMSALCEKRLIVHEAPERDQLADTAAVGVVAQDAADSRHDVTSIWTPACLPGSYRRRVVEEASRMRSISGSVRVAKSAPAYKPPNMRQPARNE